MKVLTISILFAFSTIALCFENQLKGHASPYLAMHGNDPVAWQEWNRDSLERARKEGKLLYVSSGYFSCHWCHVMQRESYKNAAVAKILNEHFIPVKVDREIAGALDSKLIDFVERTQGRAGWPLNVFITPEGYPLVGMTYVPAANFIEILNNINTEWKNKRTELEKIAIDATKELSLSSVDAEKKFKQVDAKEYINRFLIQSREMADNLSGGFGDQSKFPSVPQLSVLLQLYRVNHDEQLQHFLTLTLDQMSSQGLYDQLGDGFFRYVVDPYWQVPHFEKMLYDNALLASLYMDAARILENKKYAEVAKNTLNFMLSTLHSSQGAFIASLSAIDSRNIEGGYYLWQKDELHKILQRDEFSVVKLYWKLDGVAEQEHGHHLIAAMSLEDIAMKLNISIHSIQKLLTSAKEKMLALRSKRNIPRDDKLLAGWNGLALSAFSRAAIEYNSSEYAAAAGDIKNYIYQKLWRNLTLVRGIKNNKVYGRGELEDYAYVIKGVSDWLKIQNNEKDQLWLGTLIEQVWQEFYKKDGWHLSRESLLKYKEGEFIVVDGVLPSPSAVIIDITIKYAENTKNRNLMQRAAKALRFTSPELAEQPFWYASHIYTLYSYQQDQKQ